VAVDLPSIFACFFIILIENVHHSDLRAFVAGANAFQMVAFNAVFAVLSVLFVFEGKRWSLKLVPSST